MQFEWFDLFEGFEWVGAPLVFLVLQISNKEFLKTKNVKVFFQKSCTFFQRH